jgi:hypothetical protein
MIKNSYSTKVLDGGTDVLFDPKENKWVSGWTIYGPAPDRDVFIRSWCENLKDANKGYPQYSASLRAKKFNLVRYTIKSVITHTAERYDYEQVITENGN